MTLQSISGFVERMKRAACVRVPRSQSWSRHADQLALPDRICVIAERDFVRWQKQLSLAWQDDSVGCFRTQDGFKLFWRQGEKCYSRQLTLAQSREFAFLAGMHQAHREPVAAIDR